MNGMQTVDVSWAGDNVQNMSKMIQIRNVSDEMHRELKMRAAAAGMSLSDYIKRELGFITRRRMSREEINARLQAHGRSRITSEEVVQIIREGRGE
jgi:plasmid stability protein